MQPVGPKPDFRAYQRMLHVLLAVFAVGLVAAAGTVFVVLRESVAPAQIFTAPPTPTTNGELCPGGEIEFRGIVKVSRPSLIMRVRTWYPKDEPWYVAAADEEPEYLIPHPVTEQEVTITAPIPESLEPGEYDLRVGLLDMEAGKLVSYNIPVMVGSCNIP